MILAVVLFHDHLLMTDLHYGACNAGGFEGDE